MLPREVRKLELLRGDCRSGMSPGRHPRRCLWLQIELMGITREDSWARGPEEKDLPFQRPKGEQLRLGLRSKGRGLSRQDSGA